MPEFKYSVIRYIPDAMKDEPINIGLVLHSAADHFLAFHMDLRRVSSKLSLADRDTLKHYETQLESIENEEANWDTASFETVPVAEPAFLDKLADYIGNKIRFVTPRGCMAVDPDRAFDELFQRFVGGRHAPVRRETKRTLPRGHR